MTDETTEQRPWERLGPGDPWLHHYYERYRPQIFPEPGERLRVIVLVGSAEISGGSYVIFQHALYWKRRGADVTVATTMIAPSALHNHWHPALDELRFIALDEVGDEVYDVAIATWWRTVYDLPRIRARHAVYFVQSAEARFYAVGDETYASQQAELTYRYDLPIVTITLWLQSYLAFEHNRPAFLVRNGIDKDRYEPFGPAVDQRRPDRLRVLVEGPVDVSMKNVPDAIELARAGGADEVWLLTSSPVNSFPRVDRVLSRVPIDRTAHVYRSCDVLLKLSRVEGMYGPPLEMFHCGGTVVTYDVTGHEEYVEDEVNGLVVPMEDRDGVARAVKRLREDPALLARLKLGALETADRWIDWDQACKEFWSIIRMIARQPAPDKLVTMLAIRGAGVAT